VSGHGLEKEPSMHFLSSVCRAVLAATGLIAFGAASTMSLAQGMNAAK